MTEQPEALRLADGLERDGDDCTCMAYGHYECACDANWAAYHTKDAAAELRRLYAENLVQRRRIKDLETGVRLVGAALKEAME